jgi:hypothetical protein
MSVGQHLSVESVQFATKVIHGSGLSPLESHLLRRCRAARAAAQHAWDHTERPIGSEATDAGSDTVQHEREPAGRSGRDHGSSARGSGIAASDERATGRVLVEVDAAHAELLRAVAAALAVPADERAGDTAPAHEPAPGTSSDSAAASSDAWAQDGSLQSDLDASLTRVEAIERAKTVLDGLGLNALARMRATTGAMVDAQSEALAAKVPVTPEELVVLEVTTATGLSRRDVGRRLALATGPRARCGRLRQLVQTGQVSLYRACEVLAETTTLTDEDLHAVIQTVFAPTRDGAGLSNQLFRSRLRRALLARDPDRASKRARGRTRIGAHARIDDDGTGTLTVINDAAKIAAAMDRIDAAARAARRAGDPRSLEQLRADFLTDLACYGWPTNTCTGCPPQTGTLGSGAFGNRTGSSGANGTGTGTNGPSPNGTDTQGSHAGSDPDGRDGWTRIGRQPAATVRVIIPFTTLLGFDDAPCELPGHGWIDAEHARALATAAGSTWQGLLASLDTGTAQRLGTPGYRPTPAMVDHVRAVDHTCRGPGCHTPAHLCDLDHDIEYPLGPTHVTNLTDKERRHHNVRTARFWRAARGEHDSLIWDTAAGRRYVTYPHDWLEDTRPPRVNFPPQTHPFTRRLGPEPNPNAPPDDTPPPF